MLILLVQAAAGPPPIDFDLGRIRSKPASCSVSERHDALEIVICAKRRAGDDFRLSELPDREDGLPRAEFGVPGLARVGLRAEQVDVGGFPSKRMMVTIKIPF